MESRSRSRSPLKETSIHINGENFIAPSEIEEKTEIDVNIPVFTDEDIENIVLDIDEKDSHNLTTSMSSVEDPPAESEKQVIDEQDPENKQPTADDKANSKSLLEIDAIQKHVEESLLFLENDKATNNAPEKVVLNINTEFESSESRENINYTSDNLNKDINVSTVQVIPTERNNDFKTSPLKSTNADTPKMIDEGVKNHVNLGLVTSQENVDKNLEEQEENTTETPKKSVDGQVEPSIPEKVEEIEVTEAGNETVPDTKEEHNESSSIEDNTDYKEIIPETVNINADSTKKIVWESPLPEHDQDNVQMDEHITTNKCPLLNQAQNETSGVSVKNNEPTEFNCATDQECVQESTISLENIEKITNDPDVISKNHSEDVPDCPKWETTAKTNEKVNDTVVTTDMQEIEEIQETNEDVNNVYVDRSQQAEENNLKTDMETDDTCNKDKNVANEEVSETEHVNVWECPVLPENTQNSSKNEKMDEDQDNRPSKSSQIATKQERLDETTSDIRKETKDPESNNVIESHNKTIELDNIEDTTKQLKTTQAIDNNLNEEPSQNIWESPLSAINEKETSPEKNEKLVFNTSPHQEALSGPKVASKRAINKDDSESNSEIQEQKTEEHRHQSVDASLKVQDNDECTPAKRACVETTRSTVAQTDNAQTSPITDPAITWTQNASIDSEISSPAPSNSTRSETAQDASIRSQSSCSSFHEDIPMDVESDDGETVSDTKNFIGSVDITEFTEWCKQYLPVNFGAVDVERFASWCHQNNICKSYMKDPIRNMSLKPIMHAIQQNKAVLKLAKLPKTFNHNDVRQLIKTHTCEYGDEIANEIAFVHLEKAYPVYNLAYIKWRDHDKILVFKAVEILKRTEVNFDWRKHKVKYDDRSVIDWDENDRPFAKKKGPYILGIKEKNVKHVDITLYPQNTKILQTVPPFLTGEIDYTDKVTFGLNKDFLTHLNLKTPLTRNVIVKNIKLDLDEGKLHKIFSLAGNIQSMTLESDTTSSKLMIEYEHALEAVQAISMFHNYAIYGQTVTVSMDKPSRSKPFVLPEGCPKLGRGLGISGAPLKGVRLNIETKSVQTTMYKDFVKLRQTIASTKCKLRGAMYTQTQTNNILKQISESQNSQRSQNTPQQDPQSTIANISTVIANSIQNNLLNILGQPNLLQSLAPQNSPNWSASSADINCWTQQNAQPKFTTNAQTHPDLSANMQPTLASTQPNTPNMQTQATNMHSNMSMQPSIEALQYASTYYASMQSYAQHNYSVPPPAFQPNIPLMPQTAFINPQPDNPNPATATKPQKVSRFDIPPEPKPQTRTQPVTANVTQAKPVKPEPVKEYSLCIPPPVIKPRAIQAAFSSKLKAAPVVKPPKPAGIKINIPSLGAGSSSCGDMESIPSPVPKAKKRDLAKPLPKAKSPIKEPWINKQIKAMRRSSKSPEIFRIRSPRYDKIQDDMPSRERDYGRERERDRDRGREPDRDFTRPATLIFRYLPPSVSSVDLREKMCEIGRLVSAQVNGKGHAVVAFKYTRDAETCIEMYNKAKVDGQTIEVKWAK